MSYEAYRNDVYVAAMNEFDKPLLDKMMSFMDNVAEGFDFERKCTDLIPSDGIPKRIIESYIAVKAVANCTMNTIKNYYSVLMDMFRQMQMSIDKITPNAIRVYLNNVQKINGNCPGTADHKRIIIHDFFQWCVDEEIILRNPCRNVEPIRYSDNIREPLDNIELAQMRFACKDHREHLLIEFLFSTGCRVTEIADMKLSDIDLEKHTAIVRHGKGDKRRTTYLNAESIVAIREYLKTRTDNCEYLFVNKRGSVKHKLGKKALEREVIRIRERTDIGKKVTPHNFRHTTATRCSDAGMPIEEIQQLLGHASIKTTQRYIKVSDENVRNHHWKCM